MFVWEPIAGTFETRCVYHNETFATGGTCPRCDLDPPPDDDRDESRAPVAIDLPKVIDHERWYVEISNAFQERALELLVDGPKPEGRGKQRKANPLAAAKLADVAIKARRAAVEGAKYREDWHRVEQMERELREMRRLRRAH